MSVLFRPLWYDEAFTVWLAGLDLPRLMQATAGDVHPPLWYLVEWAAARAFGPAPWALRLPALLFGLLALWLAKNVFNDLNVTRAVQRLSLGILAVSPFMIYYSTEARMYSLLLCWVLLGAWAALRQRWAVFGAAVAGGMLTHNLMALYVIPLAWLYRRQNRGYTGLTKSALLTAILYLPWLPYAWRQVQNVSHGYWILPLSPGRVAYVLVKVIIGDPGNGALLHLSLAALLLFGLGAWAAWNADRRVLLLALGPAAAGIIVSVAVQPILIDRALIGAAPFMLVIVAWGAWRMYQLGGRWATPAGVAAVAVMVAGVYTAPRVDYRSRYGSLPVRAGEHCYHLNVSSLVLARPYLPQCDHYLYPAENDLSQSLTNQTKAAMGIDRRALEAVPSGTTWLFHNANPYSAPPEFDALAGILRRYPWQRYHLATHLVFDSDAWRLDR